MSWTVKINQKVLKKLKKFQPVITINFAKLIDDLTQEGPLISHWSNFGKLKNGSNLYHCHINGNPLIIALWLVINDEDKMMEVTDVVTHQEFDKKY